MNKMIVENAVKAAQGADLLLQDLQELNKSGDMLLSLLVLPELEKVAAIKARLEAIVEGLNSEPAPSVFRPK